MKRLLLTLLFSTSFLAIFFVSCEKKIQDLPFWKLNTVTIKAPYTATGVHWEDSLSIVLDCKLDYLAEEVDYWELNNPFISRSYATQPPPRGYQGAKDAIAAVKIVSNQTIGNYPANTPLNNIVTVEKLESEVVQQPPMPTLSAVVLNEYLTTALYHTDLINLTITERPVAGTKHIFTLEITTDSGKILTAQTEEITWN